MNIHERSVRIILAETDLKEASDISITLQNSFNATVVYCKRTDQVLQKIESAEQPFDAIISEFILSDCTGIDLYHQLRDKQVDIPFILLVETGEIEHAVKGMKMGIDAFLLKDLEKWYLELLPIIVLKEIQRRRDGICIMETSDALKESQEKYRSMMDSMKDPVYICSPDYKVMYMNSAMIKRTGYDATGEDCFKAIHDQQTTCSWCFVESIQKDQSFEQEITSPKDNRTYLLTSSPIFHQNGTISRMNIFKDITNQKKLENELIALKNTAEQASIAKTEFLANISHEIRTPLNVIMGMLDLIQPTELDPKYQEYLATAKLSANSLKIIIDDILDYSKIESGQMKLTKTDCHLRILMEQIASVMKIKSEEKNLEFSCVIDPSVPDIIQTDSQRLRQVLENIIDNAIKFTDKGKIDVSVEKEMEEGFLHFKVSDTGIGIPKEKQDIIFKGFTQVDGSITRRYGGTGLGLAISKHLVEMMGGKIWVESQINVGSTFHFTILVSDQKIEKNKRKKRKTEKRPLRILLAEDNPFNQKLIETILKTEGYDVTLADNGKIALELYEKQPFDLILMDIQMPEMDGFQTTRVIRSFEKQKGGHIPIIAITAYSLLGDREKCLLSGMDEYLRKPIQKDVLLSTIQELSERHPASSEKVLSDKPNDNNVLNRKAFMQIVGNNTNFIKELIQIYLDNLPKLMNQIENGLDKQHLRDIEFGAHALKGMSYNISAQRVADAAKKLENIGRSGNLAEADKQFRILKEEVEILKQEIDNLTKELETRVD